MCFLDLILCDCILLWGTVWLNSSIHKIVVRQIWSCHNRPQWQLVKFPSLSKSTGKSPRINVVSPISPDHGPGPLLSSPTNNCPVTRGPLSPPLGPQSLSSSHSLCVSLRAGPFSLHDHWLRHVTPNRQATWGPPFWPDLSGSTTQWSSMKPGATSENVG